MSKYTKEELKKFFEIDDDTMDRISKLSREELMYFLYDK
jgi:hypothetical protein